MTMQGLTDTELATFPAGYVTGVAYESVISFIRAQHAERGFTQPQFWLLRNLSKNDISFDGRGMTVAELRQAMSSYIRPEDDLDKEADVLVERGRLTRDAEGRLWVTESGEVGRIELKQHGPAIRARIHAGINEADYAAAVRVLTQMIRNTGGSLGEETAARHVVTRLGLTLTHRQPCTLMS